MPPWLKGLSPLDLLLVFVPLTFVAEYLARQNESQPHYHVGVFVSACLAIIPLAGMMGKATEYLADRVGAGLGGLLNATFGNACELIIAFAAMRAGLYDIVKASITGSIIGNILLVLGASVLAGGIKYDVQYFNRTAATTSATLLALGAISLSVPATFHFAHPKSADFEDDLALGIAVVLFTTYLCSLWFSLKTHKHLYSREVDDDAKDAIGVTGWSLKKSITILALATVLVAIISEFLVGSVEHTGQQLHMSQVFIGVILVAIIGNAAEHSTAILMAMKNKMDLSINIALGSGAQIALLVAPTLVFLSFFFGPTDPQTLRPIPMNLNFTPFEVLSVVVSVIILAYIATDGESNWLEGVQLLAVYCILGTAFFFSVDPATDAPVGVPRRNIAPGHHHGAPTLQDGQPGHGGAHPPQGGAQTGGTHHGGTHHGGAHDGGTHQGGTAQGGMHHGGGTHHNASHAGTQTNHNGTAPGATHAPGTTESHHAPGTTSASGH